MSHAARGLGTLATAAAGFPIAGAGAGASGYNSGMTTPALVPGPEVTVAARKTGEPAVGRS
ncbi:hypothetical protein [Arthrobacter sp. PGP41]|uniref:hypothetical protein n=1 Tax=Arthrobacter sp. PGP41 TaxID=2079227 RepID=UPI001319C366|nr:hypothetical protein [Arthrobacter sp. PGP41]